MCIVSSEKELECVADYINWSDYVSLVDRDVSKSMIIPGDLIKLADFSRGFVIDFTQSFMCNKRLVVETSMRNS